VTQRYSTVSAEDQANGAAPIEEFPKLKEQQENKTAWWMLVV